MKRYHWGIKDKVLTLVLIIVLVLVWILVIIRGNQATNDRNETRLAQEQTFALRNSIQVRQRQLNRHLEENAIHSSNPTIRNSARQIQADSQVNHAAKRLFRLLLTYDDRASYLAHQHQARSLVTDSVYHNQKIFTKDKDVSGQSYINNSHLHSQYAAVKTAVGIVQGDEVPILIRSTSNAWHVYNTKGRHDRQEQNLDKGQTEIIYTGTYNLKTKKFTNLTFENVLSQTALDN